MLTGSRSDCSIRVSQCDCLISPPDHNGLVTRNTNVWLNVEAMQHLRDIINYVIARSESNFINDVSLLRVNGNL